MSRVSRRLTRFTPARVIANIGPRSLWFIAGPNYLSTSTSSVGGPASGSPPGR